MAKPRPRTSRPSYWALSNTDKSVRIYESQNGTFLDREWGHTEAINGVALVEDDEGGRKVASVGSDGTIMVWSLDLRGPVTSQASRDPSPAKESSSSLAATRPPLRRVLSKAELAEFQRPSPLVGRRSPPRTLSARSSKYGLSPGAAPAQQDARVGAAAGHQPGAQQRHHRGQPVQAGVLGQPVEKPAADQPQVEGD